MYKNPSGLLTTTGTSSIPLQFAVVFGRRIKGLKNYSQQNRLLQDTFIIIANAVFDWPF